MKRFLTFLLSVVIIAGGLYGAWIGLEFFDNMRAGYREELSRSQFLNQAAQQRITILLEENARLQAELDELRSLPAFAEATERQIIINNEQLIIAEDIPVGNLNIEIEDEDDELGN